MPPKRCAQTAGITSASPEKVKCPSQTIEPDVKSDSSSSNTTTTTTTTVIDEVVLVTGGTRDPSKPRTIAIKRVTSRDFTIKGVDTFRIQDQLRQYKLQGDFEELMWDDSNKQWRVVPKNFTLNELVEVVRHMLKQSRQQQPRRRK